MERKPTGADLGGSRCLEHAYEASSQEVPSQERLFEILLDSVPASWFDEIRTDVRHLTTPSSTPKNLPGRVAGGT